MHLCIHLNGDLMAAASMAITYSFRRCMFQANVIDEYFVVTEMFPDGTEKRKDL